jgi:hypothetical protein
MTMARYDDRNQDQHGARYWEPRRNRRRDGDQRLQRGDYYDPDHEYRTRRYQRDSDREPYGERPMPGEYADRGRDRHITRQQADEEHAWADPSAWYGEGRYRGVGPKGYVRSDERIREIVCDDLMDDPWLDASRIEVTVEDAEVTLSGSVDSRDAKRLAEDLVERAGGVKQVQNNLRVEVRG